MTVIRLVRHGEAAGGFGDDLDPGLSPAGLAQAAEVARRLAETSPSVILTSPLRRARETAAPLGELSGIEPVLDPVVGEVPSPTDDLEERSRWLAGFLSGRWDGQSSSVRAWRDALVSRILEIDEDAVIFSHFVAVNALVAASTGDDRTTVFRPGYCSVTSLDNAGGRLAVVELGGDATTVVR